MGPQPPARLPAPADRADLIRVTLDLHPADHCALKRWCNQAAADLGLPQLPLAVVLRLLGEELTSSPDLARRILARLADQDEPHPAPVDESTSEPSDAATSRTLTRQAAAALDQGRHDNARALADLARIYARLAVDHPQDNHHQAAGSAAPGGASRPPGRRSRPRRCWNEKRGVRESAKYATRSPAQVSRVFQEFEGAA